MQLTSSLEPTGPKSTRHYLILHHNKRRDLVKLPETYADLVKHVQKLYHLDPNRFFVESKELNLCAGERVRIPEDAWSDIAQLLGNVFVVAEDAFDDKPESHPDSQQTPVHTGNQGVINLEVPLVKDEILAVNIGDIDVTTSPTASTEFIIQALDEKMNSILSVSFFPQAGSTFLASNTNDTITTRSLKEAFPLQTDHHILIFKHENRFQVLFDSHIIGVVEAPVHAPITSITYDLGGTQSPFKAPVVARVFSSPSHLRDEFKPYHAAFSPLDKQTLYRQILACNPGDGGNISHALETIRREVTSFKNSSSGAQWKGQTIPDSKWTNFDWGLRRHSVCVIRYHLTGTPSERIYIVFGPQDKYSLYIEICTDNTARFSEHTSSGSLNQYHTFQLSDSMHTAGEHSVALISQGGTIHAMFDFRQTTTLHKTTMMDRKTKETFFLIPMSSSIEADLYDFGS